MQNNDVQLLKITFIEKAKNLFQDRFDYSLIEDYKNYFTPIKLKCKKHKKDFIVKPTNHINAKYNTGACPECQQYSIDKRKKERGKHIFITKAKEKFGNKYDYSLVDYLNDKTPVKIVCPEHGIFEYTPHQHIHTHHGCPQCALIIRSSRKTKTKEQFIKEAKEIHGNDYDYSKVDYINCDKKIKIYCKRCKKYFYMTPTSHISNKQGCGHCRYERRKQHNLVSVEEFIIKSNKEHNNEYDYSLVDFKVLTEKVQIKCKKHNYIFWQIASNHMNNGARCPKCNNTISKNEYKIELF
ncbi:MAG: DUF723 domain-containing protein [Candidatus Woesearchaeota archaeon]|jgi:hypothetical protein|nr:DUF723 domain-containing protein [Candidatus Woesearchaeota archaeon]